MLTNTFTPFMVTEDMAAGGEQMGTVSMHRTDFFLVRETFFFHFPLERENGQVLRQETQIPSEHRPLTSLILAAKTSHLLPLNSRDCVKGRRNGYTQVSGQGTQRMKRGKASLRKCGGQARGERGHSFANDADTVSSSALLSGSPHK